MKPVTGAIWNPSSPTIPKWISKNADSLRCIYERGGQIITIDDFIVWLIVGASAGSLAGMVM